MTVETATAIALGITVFCMVIGSSSVPELASPGRKLRWVGLLVLLVLAVWLAVRDMWRPSLRLLVVFALTAWLAALGLVSTAWSVDPRLTFERGVSFTLALLAAAALALAAHARPRLPVRLLYGILGGVTAATLGGLVVLAVRHSEAVQAATSTSPVRYRGLGENPDTVALLVGLTAPVALWALLRTRGWWGRIAVTLVLVLLIGSLAASGSRGGLVAAATGGVVQVLLLVLLLPPWWRRLVYACAVVLVLAAAGLVTLRATRSASGRTSAPPAATAPARSSTGKPPGAPGSASEAAATRSPTPAQTEDAHYAGRLQDELDRGTSSKRSFLTSSGRLDAWRGALSQIRGRPLVGYGFGTEDHVFVPRFFFFYGSYVENSFLGTGLQLGIVGVVSLLALLAAIAAAAVRALRRPREVGDPAPVLAAAGIAGVVLMLVQSYVYSVGNVATVSFWVMSLVLAGLPARRQGLAQPTLGQKLEPELPSRAPALVRGDP